MLDPDMYLRVGRNHNNPLSPFMTEAFIIQWTGFYMIEASVIKGLSQTSQNGQTHSNNSSACV